MDKSIANKESVNILHSNEDIFYLTNSELPVYNTVTTKAEGALIKICKLSIMFILSAQGRHLFKVSNWKHTIASGTHK